MAITLHNEHVRIHKPHATHQTGRTLLFDTHIAPVPGRRREMFGSKGKLYIVQASPYFHHRTSSRNGYRPLRVGYYGV